MENNEHNNEKYTKEMRWSNIIVYEHNYYIHVLYEDVKIFVYFAITTYIQGEATV